MKLEPLANRVVMTMIEEDRKLTSGLWMPDIAHKNKGIVFAEVIAVGPGRLNAEGRHVPVHLVVGDVVMLPRAAPAMFTIEDDEGKELEVLMCPENDIIAKVSGLKRSSSLLGLDGVPLSIEPQSLAVADSVYKSREDLTRSIAYLREGNAPPDVVNELVSEATDGDHTTAGE